MNSELQQIKHSTGVRGAISELLVAADLLERGYEVFRAVSQSCSCDLVATKPNVFLSIEVRTGKRLLHGNLNHSRNNVRAMILAVVCHNEDDMIYYVPNIP